MQRAAIFAGFLCCPLISMPAHAQSALAKQVRNALAHWQPGHAAFSVSIENAAADSEGPSYSLSIAVTSSGTASLAYTGHARVLLAGDHRAVLNSAQTLQIVAALRKAALESCGAAANFVSITIAGAQACSTETATLNDALPMPRLAWQLTLLADVARWTRGDAATIPTLHAEGWDFRAADPRHADLLIAASSQGNLAIVQQLLALGAPANVRGSDRALPLFAAIEGHHADIVQLLLASGADRNLKSADDETALDLANELGYSDIAALLR